MDNSLFSKADTSKVKGIAIIMMIFHHCFLSAARYKGQIVLFMPFSEGVINDFALSMKICVAIFTFLSAYGMTLSYKKISSDLIIQSNDVRKIIIRRLISLLGGFLFIFITVHLWDIIVIGDHRYTKIYGAGLISFLFFFVDSIGLAEFFGTKTYLATFWYMSLAIVLILVLPLLINIYKKINNIIFLLIISMIFSMFFPITPKYHFVYLPHYLFCIFLAIWTADNNIIVKISKSSFFKSKSINNLLKFTGGFILLVIILYFRQKTRTTLMLPIWEGLLSLGICCFMYSFINRIPAVSQILNILGKYSMNIFLLHNFIRVVWYFEFTYSFIYWWLILFVLICDSFAIAFIIETIKHYIGYNKLMAYLRNKV